MVTRTPSTNASPDGESKELGVWDDLMQHFANQPPRLRPNAWLACPPLALLLFFATAAQGCARTTVLSSNTFSISGFSCKIHVSVDGLGYPLRLRLTGGQCHDLKQVYALLDGLPCRQVIADRGYAAQPFIDFMLTQGAAVIPPHQRAKQVRAYDTWLYRERHLVECFFNKIKHYRRVFSRFDRLASRYLGFVQFVCVLNWLH